MSLNVSLTNAAAAGAKQTASIGGDTANNIASTTSHNTNAATPLNRHSSNSSVPACNLVTGEKKTATDQSTGTSTDVAREVLFSVTCPDGSVLHLSPNSDKDGSVAPSRIILGRGKAGIPSSAVHVSRKACVLRLVQQEKRGVDTSYDVCTLELVVLGSNPCRVTRSSSSESFFVQSMSQILEDENNTSPISIILNDGDIIEPYERLMECAIDEAKKLGAYYPFKVSINNTVMSERGEEGKIDGAAFVEASKKIDSAAEIEKSKGTAVTVGVQTDFSSFSTELGNRAAERDVVNSAVTVGVLTDLERKVQELEEPIPVDNNQDENLAIDTSGGKPTATNKTSMEIDDDCTPNSGDAGEGNYCANDEDVNSLSEEELETQLEVADPNENINQQRPVLNRGKGGNGATTLGHTKEVASEVVTDKPHQKFGNKNLMNQPSFTPMDSAKVFPSAKTTDGIASNEKKVVGMTVKDSLNNVVNHALSTGESFQDCGNKNNSSSDESSIGDIAEGDASYEIKEIIATVDSPGTFAVGGPCNGKLLMPGLVVDGVGTIGLPLSDNQAKELIKLSEQDASKGGTDTINCIAEGNTCEIDSKYVKVTNPIWKKELDDITTEACRGLGVQSHLNVQAKLSKLILYEEGSVVAPQRDSDRNEGVFGTLVVVLPTQFTGGDFFVKHMGEFKIFQQAGPSGFGSQYTAYYKECKQELKRVASGHRLCLVYNLFKVGYGTLPKAVNKRLLVKRLKAAARQWENEYDDTKVIYMTQNRANQSVVEILKLAIEQGAALDFDKGTLSMIETGTGVGDIRQLERRGWGYDSDEDHNCRWGESLEKEWSLNLSTWGETQVSYSESEWLEDHFEDAKPTSIDFEPHGWRDRINATREYEDAGAIVIWPRSRRWTIATNNDTARMCKYLLKACEEGTPDSEAKEDCAKKAEVVISRVMSEKTNASHMANLMKCTVLIGDEKLAKQFLNQYISANSGIPDGIIEQIPSFIDRFGGNFIKPILLSLIDATRFSADPTGTANFLLQSCKALGKTLSNATLVQCLIEAFVDLVSPLEEKKMISQVKKDLDSFPMDAMLDLFVCGKHYSAKLAKRLLEGYVTLSCQKINEVSQYSWNSSRSKGPEGPTLLLSSSMSLLSLCEKYGWIEYEGVLIKAAEMLCYYGKANNVVELVEKFRNVAAISSKHAPDRVRTCSRMASIACKKLLMGTKQLFPSQSQGTLTTYKNLIGLIGTYCPSMATVFVESAKSLDLDSIIYPLVTDKTIRSSATESMIASLGTLTLHCAQMLKSSMSKKLGKITVWSLPNASLARNRAYANFLRDPCKRVLNWKVRKSDHTEFLQDLRPLIHLGEVKAESYQPRGKGAWFFKITKLKSNIVTVSNVNSLKCCCSPTYRSHKQTSCLIQKCKAALSKHTEDQKKILVVKSLLTPDQRRVLESASGAESRKRNMPPSSTPAKGSYDSDDAPLMALKSNKKTPALPSGAHTLQQAAKKVKTNPASATKKPSFMTPTPNVLFTTHLASSTNAANHSEYSQKTPKDRPTVPASEVIDLT